MDGSVYECNIILASWAITNLCDLNWLPVGKTANATAGDDSTIFARDPDPLASPTETTSKDETGGAKSVVIRLGFYPRKPTLGGWDRTSDSLFEIVEKILNANLPSKVWT